MWSVCLHLRKAGLHVDSFVGPLARPGLRSFRVRNCWKAQVSDQIWYRLASPESKSQRVKASKGWREPFLRGFGSIGLKAPTDRDHDSGMELFRASGSIVRAWAQISATCKKQLLQRAPLACFQVPAPYFLDFFGWFKRLCNPAELQIPTRGSDSQKFPLDMGRGSRRRLVGEGPSTKEYGTRRFGGS